MNQDTSSGGPPFRPAWIAAAVPAVMVLVAIAVVIALLLIKALWAWTIPDLFPGAVEQGLIAGQISWLTAFKLALFFGVLAGISGARGSHGD